MTRPAKAPISYGGKAGKMMKHKQELAARVPSKSGTKGGAVVPTGERKKHRWHAGTLALREIRKYQKSTELLMKHLPFQRLVRRVLADMRTSVVRFQASAVKVLQELAESHLIDRLFDAYDCTIHTGRVTLMPKDIQLARKLTDK